MKKLILLVSVLTVVFVVPVWSDCGSDCVYKCQSLGPGKEYQECLYNCTKKCYHQPIPAPEMAKIDEQKFAQIPEPNCVCAECNKKCGTGHETWCSSYRKPKNSSETENETFLVALGGKLCCVDKKGTVAGWCHELKPYYNPFSGECFATPQECKQSGGGYDVCLKCTTHCP